jgi:aminoglycoside phosphotransferase family enzyme/predicted kinase
MAGAEDSQQDTVVFLASPDAHDGRAVERIDTHISRVFMAGDRVLKLKRAVRFPESAPILDFTTLAARRAACAAEVTVNRRTAPGLYLGIAPVLPGPRLGALAADPEAADAPDAIDWVVAMRRFDQAALLDSLARRGALDASVVAALGEAVAAFHATAGRAPGYGGAEPIRRTIEGVTAELTRCANAAVGAEAADALADVLRAALAGCAGLLDARAETGFVRHCHGDLHLRNICLIDGAPVPFDAIEFNPALANIDVLYDLAFLLMDLLHRGMAAAANAVLNLYLPHEGDYDGLAALPLFMALRAGIRAEIAAGRAAAGEDPGGALAAEAGEYVALAQRLLAPAPPCLIAIGGLSGTGKSAVAAALAPETGRPPGAGVIRSDVVRKRLAGRAPTARLGPDFYTPDMTRRVYAEMAAQARAALAAGQAVIADAVHARPEERAAIEAVAAAAGAPFAGLWLDAPEGLRETRVSVRRGDASDADAAVARVQSGYALGAIRWTRVDAGGALDDVVASCGWALHSPLKRQRL